MEAAVFIFVSGKKPALETNGFPVKTRKFASATLLVRRHLPVAEELVLHPDLQLLAASGGIPSVATNERAFKCFTLALVAKLLQAEAPVLRCLLAEKARHAILARVLTVARPTTPQHLHNTYIKVPTPHHERSTENTARYALLASN